MRGIASARAAASLKAAWFGTLWAGKGLLSLVAPPACASCGGGLDAAGDLCRPCEESLPVFPPPSCAGCGGIPRAGPTDFCSRCRGGAHRDGLVALAPLEGRVREMVHAFKYRGDLRAGKCLTRRLAAKVIAELEGRCDVIVPVPLHPRRLRSRGFNQAALLARGISRSAGWPLYAVALERKADTRSLTGLGVRERRREVRGAVAVRSPSAVAGRRVLLVDDVFTTGATAEECCRALKRAGAREVYVAAVGRA